MESAGGQSVVAVSDGSRFCQSTDVQLRYVVWRLARGVSEERKIDESRKYQLSAVMWHCHWQVVYRTDKQVGRECHVPCAWRWCRGGAAGRHRTLPKLSTGSSWDTEADTL